MWNIEKNRKKDEVIKRNVIGKELENKKKVNGKLTDKKE